MKLETNVFAKELEKEVVKTFMEELGLELEVNHRSEYKGVLTIGITTSSPLKEQKHYVNKFITEYNVINGGFSVIFSNVESNEEMGKILNIENKFKAVNPIFAEICILDKLKKEWLRGVDG